MASAPAISAAAMMRGILRYESRAGAGPMQTSSSAKRTCSDSRSASLYTATVATPSSRHARMTRSAISPRFAIRTFLNMRRSGDRRRGCHLWRQIDGLWLCLLGRHLVELPVGRGVYARNPQCELVGVGRVEQGAFVGDHSVLVPLHQRLVEGLHTVRRGALCDEVRNVERLLDIPDVV